MKHTRYDLKQMQSLPLEAKIAMTQRRISDWYDYWNGSVYVSFSGGKDSTVLKHIVDAMGYVVPAVFINTGLEYPEIQKFVRDIKEGKHSCFNPNVEILRPEMRFDEVIKKYGFPVISKTVAHNIAIAKRNPDGLVAKNLVFNPNSSSLFNCYNWRRLVTAPFSVSDQCCYVMKKKPVKQYHKTSGRMPMLGTMAQESKSRYASDYSCGTLTTTGVSRTGCMFCMFGCHLEKEPNRFQRMKQTHPQQYAYCMDHLGLKEVLDYIGVSYA